MDVPTCPAGPASGCREACGRPAKWRSAPRRGGDGGVRSGRGWRSVPRGPASPGPGRGRRGRRGCWGWRRRPVPCPGCCVGPAVDCGRGPAWPPEPQSLDQPDELERGPAPTGVASDREGHLGQAVLALARKPAFSRAGPRGLNRLAWGSAVTIARPLGCTLPSRLSVSRRAKARGPPRQQASLPCERVRGRGPDRLELQPLVPPRMNGARGSASAGGPRRKTRRFLPRTGVSPSASAQALAASWRPLTVGAP